MICFHFSIFEPLETTDRQIAFRLAEVVICFHFSIFEPLETTKRTKTLWVSLLWFAFILVSLNHWKQRIQPTLVQYHVVICFHFSIFEPLETTKAKKRTVPIWLWFAFILVSLNHWKQRVRFFTCFWIRCDLLSF